MSRGGEKAEHIWRTVAAGHAHSRRPGKRSRDADRAGAAARERVALANAEAAAALVSAAEASSAATQAETVAEAQAAATQAASAATAIASAAAVAKARRRRGDPEEFWALADTALHAAGGADAASIRAVLAQPAAPRAPMRAPRSTEGQCEGTTRLGERCKVHKSSRHGAAAPLRRGERHCVHHDPNKYTGMRCAGVRKEGRGQCNVWSGSGYADAAPLRRGSKFCHHHRVQCAGLTRAGTRCNVTSSSEHDHAEPLRQGEALCRHHQPDSDAGPSGNVELSGDGSPAVCEACGSYALFCQCEALRTWEAEERDRARRMARRLDDGDGEGFASDCSSEEPDELPPGFTSTHRGTCAPLMRWAT